MAKMKFEKICFLLYSINLYYYYYYYYYHSLKWLCCMRKL